MSNPFTQWLNLAQQGNRVWMDSLKMGSDIAQVVDYRTKLIGRMTTDPQSFADPGNWMELHQMYWEKVIAFNQSFFASTAAAFELMTTTDRSFSSLVDTGLRLQKKVIKPVAQTVAQNSRRLKKRPES